MLGKARELFANKIAQPIQRAYTQADIKPVLQAVSPAFNVANNLYQASQSAQRFNAMPLGPNKVSINQAVQQVAPNAAAGFGKMISGQGVMPSAYSNTAGRYIGNFAQNLVGIAPSVVDRNKNFGQKVGDFTGSAGAAMSGLTGLSGLGGNLAQTAIGTGLQYAGSKLGNQPFNLGQAFDQSQRLGYQAGAVAGVTNPLVAQSLARVQGGARLAGAGANVAQGMLIDKATGQQTTPFSAGTDFALGLIGGPQQFSGDIKGIKRGAQRVASDIEQTQKMALERMRVDPNFADQAGMIKVGNNYRIIHPEDRARMVELIDYARLGGSRKAQNRQLELDATRIAEKYGIRTPKTLGGLANEFDKTLRDIKKVNPNKWLGQAGFIAGPKAFGYKDAPNKFSSLIDKKPRFEVDDSGAKIKDFKLPIRTKQMPYGLETIGPEAKLSDILDHKELFKQYPELKDVTVKFGNNNEMGQSGSYDPVTNSIRVNAPMVGDEIAGSKGWKTTNDRYQLNDKSKSTLLHEIQHAIQQKEGFARGGSPDRMAASNKVLQQTYQNEFNQLEKQLGKIKDPKKSVELENRLMELDGKISSLKNDGLNEYARLSGEVEARAVQNRMDMPAGQRPLTDPYAAETIATVGSTDPNKLITRFGDGEAMSVKFGNEESGFKDAQYSQPYKRGDIQAIKNELDAALGTTNRAQALHTLETAASSGGLEAQRYLARVRELENQLANATLGREAGTPKKYNGITTIDQNQTKSVTPVNENPFMGGLDTNKPFVSERDLKPKIKTQQSAALDDFKEWDRALKEQEGLVSRGLMTNKNLNAVTKTVGTELRPSYLTDAKLSETKDISGMAAGMRDVYRNFDAVFGQNSQAHKQILVPFDKAKAQLVDELNIKADELDNNIVQKYGFKKGSPESAAIMQYGEGRRDLPSLVQEFGDKKAAQIVEADKWFRQQYDSMLEEVNRVRSLIYPNNPEKIIPRRSDYYRHFTDLSDTFAGLKNLFDNPANISPELAGLSARTKPKSKWLSFAQKRLGMKTDEDAIGGYIDYVKAQSFAKNIDPFIEKFRGLRESIVNATSEQGNKNYAKLNNFVEYLDDFANDLAGKTNEYDRALQKVIGRKPMRVLNWINNRTKANMIVGNVSSAVSQFFNIPQGIAEAGPLNSGKGVYRSMAGLLDKNAKINESEFIKTRYSGGEFDRFDSGLLQKPKQFALWVTGIGDQIGTKFIWNSIYEKALAERVADPIRYADDLTRKMVAGRGIGEVPLLQKAKTFQLIAPFQLEVANIWHVMSKWAGEKAAGKFVTFFIASHIMNRIAAEVRGSDVSLDPIQAVKEAYQTFNEEEDKRTGLLKAGGRVAGELLSNIPGGQSVASIYPEFGVKVGDNQLPTREDLFGQGDPTRFGSGLLAAKGLQDPLFLLVPEFGGQQIKRTFEGLKAYQKGFSESKSGRVRYPIEQNPQNLVKTAAFGQYATPEARQYFESDGSVLGEKQSAYLKSLPQEQRAGFFNTIRGEKKSDFIETDAAMIKSRLQSNPSEIKPEELANYYTREINLKANSSYETAMAEKKIWSRLSDLENSDSLSDQQKSQTRALLLEKVGITPEDYQYYEVAKQTNALKSMYAKEELTKLLTTGADKQQVYNWLTDNRREVNGNQVLTSGVIDSLVDANIISYADGASLKKLQVTGTGKKRSVSSKKKSSKIRVPKPKKISFKVSTPKVKKIAAKKFKPVKLKNVSIRLKARRIA